MRLRETLYVWSNVFSLLKRVSPFLSIAVAIVTLAEAIIGVGVLYVIKLLVDAISIGLSSQAENPIVGIFPYLILTAFVLICAILLQNVGTLLRLRQGISVGEYVDKEIHTRAISVDLKFYESPLYYDSLERARHGGSQRPAQIVSSAILTIRASIILIGVIVLLASINLLLIPVLLTPVLIALSVRLFFTRALFQWRTERAQLDRRANYLDWLLTSVVHAKELRLHRTGTYFRDQYHALRTKLNAGQIRIEQSKFWSELAVASLGALVFVAACTWLLQQSLTEARPIGDVVLFVMLLRRSESSGNEMVGNMSKLVDDHLYLKNLFDFLNIKPDISQPANPNAIPQPLIEGLQVSNMSFRYDGAPENSLTDVSLKLRPGQIVAIVGENGSGKTTLIKLLTRLYDPDQGEITLDGIDIRSLNPDEYRGLFSVIFQDFAKYADSAGDNIWYGDIGSARTEDRLKDAASKAAALNLIEDLPDAFSTRLTKLFDDGHDLSIGQWQRLALARAFYPASRFMILDEPTSAIDPKAEFEFFDTFRRNLEDRGALIISHRLSTVRLADYTYVLKNGRIVEHGTHASLMQAKGGYAELFERQAEYYR